MPVSERSKVSVGWRFRVRELQDGEREIAAHCRKCDRASQACADGDVAAQKGGRVGQASTRGQVDAKPRLDGQACPGPRLRGCVGLLEL